MFATKTTPIYHASCSASALEGKLISNLLNNTVPTGTIARQTEKKVLFAPKEISWPPVLPLRHANRTRCRPVAADPVKTVAEHC